MFFVSTAEWSEGLFGEAGLKEDVVKRYEEIVKKYERFIKEDRNLKGIKYFIENNPEDPRLPDWLKDLENYYARLEKWEKNIEIYKRDIQIYYRDLQSGKEVYIGKYKNEDALYIVTDCLAGAYLRLKRYDEAINNTY